MPLSSKFLLFISIHAPAKGATAAGIKTVQAEAFQSTLPRRERLFPLHNKTRAQFNFNPRSREGSDATQIMHQTYDSYFNPRSREGSDNGGDSDCGGICQISIHAPAKGATLKIHSPSRVMVISIHAPAEGATEKADTFNDKMEISIHAPAEGATMITQQMWHFRQISIHAPAEGATQLQRLFYPIQIISIHAPAEGATEQNRKSRCINANFNPRSRGGSDILLDGAPLLFDISIHAPAEGATNSY